MVLYKYVYDYDYDYTPSVLGVASVTTGRQCGKGRGDGTHNDKWAFMAV